MVHTQGFTLGCRVVPLRGWAASGARCTTLKRVSAEEFGPQPVSSLARRVSRDDSCRVGQDRVTLWWACKFMNNPG